MKPTLTLRQFVDAWANVHLKESSAYVTHFGDLCTLVGHPKPAHMDKTGETFTCQKGALKEQAGEIVELRDNWLNPYKGQPAGLQNAHRKLDAAVFAAYGWPSNLSDDEILARPLELNLKRAGQS